MNVLKRMKLASLALIVAIAFTSCSSDDDAAATSNKGTLKLVAKTNYKKTAARATDAVMLSKFLVNFKEIELELSDDFYNSEDDVELKGPWEIDLLAQNSFSLVNIQLPNGIYEEVEFEFDKSENKNSELFGKSMQITGEINGKPFIFWHDFEEGIEIDFEDSGRNLIIDSNTTEIAINFDLMTVLDLVDLSTAKDGNDDGTIMISPNDADGNNNLAKKMKQAIKAQIELMDDLD